MAYAGKQISNPKTGQSIKFLQTARDTEGMLLEMESTWKPSSKEPAPHYHPYQKEVFTILSGEISVRINGEVSKFTEGQQLVIQKNTVHSMWNHSSLPVTANWKVIPALETEEFFETAMGLANNNKTNDAGMPNLLQSALLIDRFKEEFMLSKPSALLQTIIFGILKPIAKLAGYKAYYKNYID